MTDGPDFAWLFIERDETSSRRGGYGILGSSVWLGYEVLRHVSTLHTLRAHVVEDGLRDLEAHPEALQSGCKASARIVDCPYR